MGRPPGWHDVTLHVMPAPVRFDGGGDQFVLRTGTTVAYSAAGVAAIVGAVLQRG
jgi:hypothetical protein